MTANDPFLHERTPPSTARRRLLGLLAALPFGMVRRTSASATVPGVARPWHHLPDGTFRNPPGSPERGGGFAEWSAFFYRRLVRPPEPPVLPPDHVLPEAAAAAGLADSDGAASVTWLGHASFLIRLGGRTLLTDPYLTERASPFSGFGPARFARAGLPPERLPPIDVLLLSHNHYDHLDLRALERIGGLERTTAVMPLGVSRYLDPGRFGRAFQVDWMQRVEAAGISITAVPAIHFSKRGLFDRNATLWCGYHLEAGGRSLLFTGDTAYGPVFKETAARLPAPELALVPIGAYEPRLLMRGSHCTPEEAVQIGRDWGARRLCAMHWGTIQLTDEPVLEPPARFAAAAAAGGYAPDDAWTLAIGETRRL
jgi:L-ascorbate metabolism protein UlaG (beta-lactamase superfamily)